MGLKAESAAVEEVEGTEDGDVGADDADNNFGAVIWDCQWLFIFPAFERLPTVSRLHWRQLSLQSESAMHIPEQVGRFCLQDKSSLVTALVNTVRTMQHMATLIPVSRLFCEATKSFST